MFRSVLCALVALLLLPAVAAAGSELSTNDRLQDRRYVAAGDRAYSVGFQDGRWYAQGWHVNGEMGGVWSQPLKFVDGVWFGIDDEWVGPATKNSRAAGATSAWDLPETRRPRAHADRVRA